MTSSILWVGGFRWSTVVQANPPLIQKFEYGHGRVRDRRSKRGNSSDWRHRLIFSSEKTIPNIKSGSSIENCENFSGGPIPLCKLSPKRLPSAVCSWELCTLASKRKDSCSCRWQILNLDFFGKECQGCLLLLGVSGVTELLPFSASPNCICFCLFIFNQVSSMASGCLGPP